MRTRLAYQTVAPYETARKELKFVAELARSRSTGHVLVEIDNKVKRIPVAALMDFEDAPSAVSAASGNVVTLPVPGDYGSDYGPDYKH